MKSQSLFRTVKGCFFAVGFIGIIPVAIKAQTAEAKITPDIPPKSQWKAFPQNLPLHLNKWKRISARPLSASQSVTVALKLPAPAALEAFVERVNDLSSPDYHQFLTSEQFTRLYAPSQVSVALVTEHLKTFGLSITEVLPNRLSVKAEGTTAQIQKAFATTIALYRSGKDERFANETAPRLPEKVAAVVDDIYGLDNAPGAPPLHQVPPPSLPYNANHLRTAYNLNPFYAKGLRGAGKTIAIFSSFVTTANDTTRYITDWVRTMASTPAFYNANITYINVDGGPTGGNVEADLDLQQVLSVAPDAAIRFYQGPNTGQGQFDVRARIVSDNSADIVSESYGGAESVYYTSSQHTQFVTASSQGMSYFASSGDFGSTNDTAPANPNAIPPVPANYTLSASFPASDPNVIAVGGTSAVLDKAFNITSETGWNGSGGGFSIKFFAPSWQSNTANGQNQFLGIANPGNVRLVPDVSSHSIGCLTYTGGGNSSVGGTSASAPFWAAATALMENLNDSLFGAFRQGNLNNRWYILGTTGAFRDITAGNNRRTGTGTNYDCKGGFDLVTGWGSTDFWKLGNRLLETFIFVDKNNTSGIQNGTPQYPYKTVITAINAASNNGRTGIYIRDGSYNEIFYTGKKLSFYNWYRVGVVKIGAP